MDFETLRREIEVETAAWQDIRDRAAACMERRTMVVQQAEALVGEMEGLTAALGAANTEIGERLAGLFGDLDRLEQATTDLPQRLTEVREGLNELINATWKELDSVVEDAAESLREESGQIFGEAGSALETEAEELRGFLEEDVLEVIQERCEETLDSVSETCTKLVESVDERFAAVVETAHERTAELMEQLDSFGENWTKNVTEVKDAYEKLVEEITGLGDDVTTLTEGIDAALDTTGIGMNAAAGTLDDIRSVMTDIV
jgi:chromosome segregation ATPase